MPPRRPPARPNRTGRASALLVLSVLANLGLIGWVAYTSPLKDKLPALGSEPPPPVPVATAGTGPIGALGRVQPVGGVIAVFGPPGDRVLRFKDGLALGTPVKAGEELGELSGDRERQLAVDALTAQLNEAVKLKRAIEATRAAGVQAVRAEVEQARAKADADVAAAEAKINVAGLQRKRGETELNRLRQAKADNVPISAQELLAAETLVQQAAEELAAARKGLAAAAVQREKAEAAAKAKEASVQAEADRGLAQVPVDSLKAQLSAAELKLADAKLRAAATGRVVKLNAHPGDTLSTLPVLQIADTDQMAVIAEVYETQIAQLRDWLKQTGGRPVDVDIDARVLGGLDAAPHKGTATLAGVAPMIAKNQVFALGPREDADRRVVEVEVRLTPAAAAAMADFIGLQVRVTFNPPR
ncbi:MAG: HlyD family efflux transporter periplasmic adaptor subunit [Gemmataceae bacterium]